MSSMSGSPYIKTGMEALPENLSSIQDIQPFINPKEAKQFLCSAGYYRKIVPQITDISRLLTSLT